MAEFNTNCPHCGAELVADEAWIGMEVECPTCNKSFTVAKETPIEKPSVPTLNLPKLTPQKEETALPTLTPLAPTAPAEIKLSPIGNTSEATETEENSFVFVCPACGTQVELPAIMKGKKYECKACAEESIAEATTEKKCPFCGEMIKIHATVCKHCKKDVTNAPINMPPPKEETFPYFCPECDTFVELPVSMDGKEYECKSCCETNIAKPATERKCPACGEMIKIKATICKHCKKSVPPLMVNNTINLQPIGNSAINLQQIQPIQSNGVSLQPVGNFPISTEPMISKEKIEQINAINKIVYPILIASTIIAWIIAIICCFLAPLIGILIFVLSPVIALLVLLIMPKEQLELDEDEYLISTARLAENKIEIGYQYSSQTVFFARMTNKRMILSSINYPFLPALVAAIFDMMREPAEIVYSWNIDDILRIDITKEVPEIKALIKIKIKRTVLTIITKEGQYKFLDKGKTVTAWWNNVNACSERN